LPAGAAAADVVVADDVAEEVVSAALVSEAVVELVLEHAERPTTASAAMVAAVNVLR